MTNYDDHPAQGTSRIYYSLVNMFADRWFRRELGLLVFFGMIKDLLNDLNLIKLDSSWH